MDQYAAFINETGVETELSSMLQHLQAVKVLMINEGLNAP